MRFVKGEIMKIIVLFFMIISQSTFAASPYSKTAGDSYAKLPNAKKGGVVFTRLAGNPKALNPLLSEDVDSTNEDLFLFSHLFDLDHETIEFSPVYA